MKKSENHPTLLQPPYSKEFDKKWAIQSTMYMPFYNCQWSWSRESRVRNNMLERRCQNWKRILGFLNPMKLYYIYIYLSSSMSVAFDFVSVGCISTICYALSCLIWIEVSKRLCRYSCTCINIAFELRCEIILKK